MGYKDKSSSQCRCYDTLKKLVNSAGAYFYKHDMQTCADSRGCNLVLGYCSVAVNLLYRTILFFPVSFIIITEMVAFP